MSGKLENKLHQNKNIDISPHPGFPNRTFQPNFVHTHTRLSTLIALLYTLLIIYERTPPEYHKVSLYLILRTL